MINLAGILYAALTGRWPGVARSAVPKAPRESRRPLRPRQVRAGVPRTLDAICERVLHKEASQHAMPIETAHEIAAALADYVGDPGTHRTAHGSPGCTPSPTGHPGAGPRRDPARLRPALDPEATQRVAAAGGPEATQQVAAPEADPEATQRSPHARSPDREPSHSTGQRGRPTRRHAESTASPSTTPRRWHRCPAPAERGRSAPALPRTSPERPLFASHRAPGAGGRRAPVSRRAASPWSTPRNPDSAGTAAGLRRERSGRRHAGHRRTGPEFWPFADNPDEAKNDVHTGKEGRGWLRTAIVVGVLLVLVVAMAIAFNRGRQDGGPTTDSGPPSNPRSSAQAQGGAAIKLGRRDATSTPGGDPPEENPDEAPNAIDGDPATSWTTSTYRGNPALGGLKPGVGLMVDLGKDQEVASVTIRFKGAPTSFEVYAAPAGVTEAPGLHRPARQGRRPSRTRREQRNVQLDPSAKTRYLLVWLTKLPEVPGGFSGEITDITVRS